MSAAIKKRPPGRQKQMENGHRVQVYLDPKSIALAETLGAGSISLGIRLALQATVREKKK